MRILRLGLWGLLVGHLPGCGEATVGTTTELLVRDVSARSAVSGDLADYVDPVQQVRDAFADVLEAADAEARLAMYQEILRVALASQPRAGRRRRQVGQDPCALET